MFYIWIESNVLCSYNDQEIKLEPDEYLVTIRGSLGKFNGVQVMTSLVFVSNKRSYAASGDAPATINFNLPVNSGKISGFFGKYGWYLDTIGVFMAPINPSP